MCSRNVSAVGIVIVLTVRWACLSSAHHEVSQRLVTLCRGAEALPGGYELHWMSSRRYVAAM